MRIPRYISKDERRTRAANVYRYKIKFPEPKRLVYRNDGRWIKFEADNEGAWFARLNDLKDRKTPYKILKG